MLLPILIFLVFFLLVSSVAVGMGYLLYWILPIGLESAIVAGAILASVSIWLTIKLVSSLNEKQNEEEEEIIIPMQSMSRFTQPYIRKKRKK